MHVRARLTQDPATGPWATDTVARALAHLHDPQPPSWLRILKREGGGAVLAIDHDGRALILKLWPCARAGERLKWALRASRAERHWRGALRLARAGVPAARCLALGHARGPAPSAAPLVWLLMERAPGPTLLHVLAGRTPAPTGVRTQHALACLAGQACARMVLAGFVNRDAKPSNWIVGALDTPDPALVAIDCVGLRPDTLRARVTMLASLLIEARGLRTPVRRTLALRALREFVAHAGLATTPARQRAELRAYWHAAAAHIARHGEGRPLVDPLSEPVADPPAQP